MLIKSFLALRYTLHPPPSGGDETMKGLKPSPPPIRIFVLGARAESSLPRQVWLQLTYLFPRAKFHVILVGPEAMAGRDAEFPLPPRGPVENPRNPFGAVIEGSLGGAMKISTYVDYYHTLHRAGEFGVFDPYFDVFVAFHPGLGHPASSHEWDATLPCLLETKCPVICTGYTEWDMERDRRWVVDKTTPKVYGQNVLTDEITAESMRAKRDTGEMDILLEPGENIFRSLRWDLSDVDPNDVSCGNFGVWCFRGKRYETVYQSGELEE